MAADKLLATVARSALGLGGLAVVPYFCLFDVDGGQRAIVLNQFTGLENRVRGEGTHFKIPLLHRPMWYDVRARPKLIETKTGTKDLQRVTIHVRLLFRPDIEAIPYIHNNYGANYDDRVLPSIANEVMKATVAQYNAEQLLTHREQVSREIREAIVARATQFRILLDDVSITHLIYGKEFAKAIEEKQVAEQEAEKQKFIVLRAEQERQATVIKSEGEAESAKMICEAFKTYGNGLIDMRRIDAAKDIAESLAKSPNVMYLPSGQQMLLNVAGGQRAQ